ncbi:drug resistance transporter EmrB/QacA subfamily [Staphylotrichum tortipilum]|uniref:Drug resistance transporter EmrB/QacA subfamily n=1 Tax=Staphylotrichum tortipilum TaxID=2831512 RepID=A0AAN6MQP5_9PEZI|nr:drug resistance transporter EmrB/QacA subfamily [Staphylotrichum longicolle]
MEKPPHTSGNETSEQPTPPTNSPSNEPPADHPSAASTATAKDQPPSTTTAAQNASATSPADPHSPSKNEYMHGWRLYALTAGIWIALFLSTLETTIVSTSLLSIADALSGFEERNWVVTAYFLTYTGFLVIYAKLASIFGSKTMFLFALTMFTLFSVACGAARTMTQLIILRAFQGIGGSGIYSMVLVLAPELVPVTEYGKYIGIISSVFALASVTGPLVGGAIASTTSWRWVFLLNGPPGVLAFLIIATFLPSSKAHDGLTLPARLRAKFSPRNTSRVDFPGAVSLLGASVLLVFALESGGTRYAWASAAVIAPLCLSGVLWVVFVVWEMRLERVGGVREPVFPVGLVRGWEVASMMVTTFLIGFPFVTILFLIPQHAQAVYGLSPSRASLTVLPLLLTSPAATAASGVLTSTFNVPPSYLIIVGSVIQVVGVGLGMAIPLVGEGVSARQYGFEAVMGVGFGLTLSTVLTLGQLVVEKADAGVVMSALTQIRVLGGTVSLAVCSAVLSNYLREHLAAVITPAEFGAIAETFGEIEKLGPERVAQVRLAFAEGYRRQFQILTGFSGAALLAALFLISRHPVTVKEVARRRDGAASESAEEVLEVREGEPKAAPV